MEGASTALDPSFFNDRERAHMADVRRLFTIDKALAAFSLILTCVLFFTRPRVGATALLCGGVLAVGVVIVAGIWAGLDFDSFFTAFHKVAFNNDLWQLNPSTSNLLKLVPEPFFADAGVRVGLLAAAHGALLGFAGFFTRKIVKEP